MKVLLTGAGGFVGQALLKRLLVDGDEVIAVDARLAHIDDHLRLQKAELDLTNLTALSDIFGERPDAIIHLAAVPGGAAEADTTASRRVNLDASLDLLDLAASLKTRPRLVFSSTIAVFGDPLPADGVGDETPLRPKMIYGMHKAMMETAVAAMTRRGAIDGVSLRLPGIVARPLGPSGLKSVFMSDIFHKLLAGEGYVLPISADAQLWVMSVKRCIDNLVHALRFDSTLMPPSRVVTLPALRIGMRELVEAIAKATGAGISGVSYNADEALEAAFGAHPMLSTKAADHAGFAHDGDSANLVANAISAIKAST